MDNNNPNFTMGLLLGTIFTFVWLNFGLIWGIVILIIAFILIGVILIMTTKAKLSCPEKGCDGNCGNERCLGDK